MATKKKKDIVDITKEDTKSDKKYGKDSKNRIIEIEDKGKINIGA